MLFTYQTAKCFKGFSQAKERNLDYFKLITAILIFMAMKDLEIGIWCLLVRQVGEVHRRASVKKEHLGEMRNKHPPLFCPSDKQTMPGDAATTLLHPWGSIQRPRTHSSRWTGWETWKDTTEPWNLPVVEPSYPDFLWNKLSLPFKTHLGRFPAPCSWLHIDKIVLFIKAKHKTLKNVQIPVSSWWLTVKTLLFSYVWRQEFCKLHK